MVQTRSNLLLERYLFCSRIHLQFFGWVQDKLNAVQSSKKTNLVSATHHTKREPPKEEFKDWPHGLLTIGTFGNHGNKRNNETIENAEIEQNQPQTQNSPPSSEDELADFTPEEVGQLQKELKKLLKKKSTSKAERENSDLPLDRFLNCPSSLEVSRRYSNEIVESEEVIDMTIRVIIDRCKDVCRKKSKKNMAKNSISFLFKKFVCSSGFATRPSLVDTFQETRMEKLLRSIITKKIYPRNTSRPSIKKYLENGENKKIKKDEDQAQDEANEASKWVKTDSDFIVLEI